MANAALLPARPDDAAARPHTRPVPGTKVRWVLGLTTASILAAMAYSLFWSPVVRGRPGYWVTPGDFWMTVKVARLIGSGHLGTVYGAHADLVTLPGYHILLAPLAVLCRALGLAVYELPHHALPQPSAWLVLGPFVLATTAPLLASIDRLGVLLGVSDRRRTGILVAATLAAWPALQMWGHPEDVLAVALCTWSLTAVLEGRLNVAGWLLGAAITTQLLAVMIVPVLVGYVGGRKALGLLARAAIPPGAILLTVLVGDFGDTFRTLTKQPNFPVADHPTPWMHLSPPLPLQEVAAGPARMIGVAVAVICGLQAYRWRLDPKKVLWLCVVALFARCEFEAVMDPYYVMPAVVLAILLAAFASRSRWHLVLTGAGGITVLTFQNLSMWVYWLQMTVLVAAICWGSYPSGDDLSEWTVGARGARYASTSSRIESGMSKLA
jgi:hypothetical protein